MKNQRLILPALIAAIAIAVGVIIIHDNYTLGSKGAGDGRRTIAVATLMPHPALDALQEHMLRVLAEGGFTEDNTDFIFRNANGQVTEAAGIAQSLVARKPDLIVAITTPMAQAVAGRKSGIPLVFAAVTDPVGAGLVKDLDSPIPGVSGTSDAWPYEDQLKLIREITPEAKKLGVLYNPGEAASQYGIKKIRQFAPKYGFELVEGAVSNTSEVRPVAQSLASRSDALFLSSDNTVISGVAAALQVAMDQQMPLYVGDSGTVRRGGLAAVSVGYPKLGTETGRIALLFLKGHLEVPVSRATGDEIYLNAAAAKLMGIELPQWLRERATEVFETIDE